MKVLLLTSAEPKQRFGLSMIEKRFPLGLGYLAAILQGAGHEVVIHDRFLLGPNSYPDGENWDLVGIYSSTPTCADTFHLLEYYQGFVTAVGGPHATLFPETLKKADAIVQGEGEVVILEILAGRRGVIKTARIPKLDVLPSPAYELFADNPHYDTRLLFAPGKYFNMNTSRGCPFACSFCDVKRIWGREYRAFSSERVIQEARLLRDKYRIDGVYFREDNFTVSSGRVEAIAVGLQTLGLKWACETRVDTLTASQLQLMGDCGCVGVYVGFESGSQRMLEVFNKQTTVEQADRFANWCYNAGISIMGSFITDHPDERPEDRSATLAFVQRHKSRALVKVNYNQYRDFSHYAQFIPGE